MNIFNKDFQKAKQREADEEFRRQQMEAQSSTSSDTQPTTHADLPNVNEMGQNITWGKTSEEFDLHEKRRLDLKDKMPWVEKYRPETLHDVISHDHILGAIDKLMESGNLPHLLLHGPPGTGKTSTALSIARRLNGRRNFRRMVLELNASDERGIDTVREKIKEFASTKQIINSFTNPTAQAPPPPVAPTHPGATASSEALETYTKELQAYKRAKADFEHEYGLYTLYPDRGFTPLKLIILDEADSMTRTAQFALRRIMELYTRSTRFIIIANYVNKIIPALQSRCTIFRFSPLKEHIVHGYLLDVCEKEGLDYTPEGVTSIIQLSKGDMRLCLNILQSCHSAYARIDVGTVYRCTGQPHPDDISTLLKVLLQENLSVSFQHLTDLRVSKGLSLLDIITNIYQLILRMNLPDSILGFVVTQFSDIELALNRGCNENLQSYAFAGVLSLLQQMITSSPTPLSTASLLEDAAKAQQARISPASV